MSLLSDRCIRDLLAHGGLGIEPLGEDAVRPASVDLRLGPSLLIPDDNQDTGYREHDLREAPYRLYQGGFVLGHTLETVVLPAWLAGVLAGKSSRAREGLVVESAGYVDPGWRGELTLELANLAPTPAVLTLGLRIAQIRFERLFLPSEKPYGSDHTSHYQSSRGAVPSRARGEAVS